MNNDSLKNCIVTLKKLRDTHNSQLDARVLGELDDVIAELNKLSENKQDSVIPENLMSRTLEIISKVITAVSNLSELMEKLMTLGN